MSFIPSIIEHSSRPYSFSSPPHLLIAALLSVQSNSSDVIHGGSELFSRHCTTSIGRRDDLHTLPSILLHQFRPELVQKSIPARVHTKRFVMDGTVGLAGLIISIPLCNKGCSTMFICSGGGGIRSNVCKFARLKNNLFSHNSHVSYCIIIVSYTFITPNGDSVIIIIVVVVQLPLLLRRRQKAAALCKSCKYGQLLRTRRLCNVPMGPASSGRQTQASGGRVKRFAYGYSLQRKR